MPMYSNKGAKVVLSPLTTIENQFLNLTNDIVVYGEENCILGAGPSKEDQINEGNVILAKKMNATQKHMHEAMYKLSRLVEDANNLHKVIEPGRPIVADMHEDLPYYYKIECTEGYISPIYINIDDLTGNKC